VVEVKVGAYREEELATILQRTTANVGEKPV
jgi:hypothetical protein